MRNRTDTMKAKWREKLIEWAGTTEEKIDRQKGQWKEPHATAA